MAKKKALRKSAIKKRAVPSSSWSLGDPVVNDTHLYLAHDKMESLKAQAAELDSQVREYLESKAEKGENETVTITIDDKEFQFILSSRMSWEKNAAQILKDLGFGHCVVEQVQEAVDKLAVEDEVARGTIDEATLHKVCRMTPTKTLRVKKV